MTTKPPIPSYATEWMLDAFRSALKCREAADAFDTKPEVSRMNATAEKIDFEALGERWRVSSRTVRRWHKRGIDVHDPIAILETLAIEMQRPKIEAIEAVLDELQLSQS
jgi:hypothetical protein